MRTQHIFVANRHKLLQFRTLGVFLHAECYAAGVLRFSTQMRAV